MRGPRSLWFLIAGVASLLAVAAAGHAVHGLEATLASGQAHHVEVAHAGNAEVLAGLVTQTEEGPLGIGSSDEVTTSGWVVAHPESAEVPDEVRVQEDVPFEDPNGGTWTQRVVDLGGETGWAVPVDVPRHDPTLDTDYNFALVVDWDLVPQDADLTVSYVGELELVR